MKWYNATTRIGILRVPRDFTDMYLSSMFFIKQIASMPCSLSILHVSGTVIFIQQAAIDWDRRFYLKEQEEADKKGLLGMCQSLLGRNADILHLCTVRRHLQLYGKD